MKLSGSPAPHIRYAESNRTLMSDVLVLLLVLCALASMFYGVRALVICLVSVATAYVCDILSTLMRVRRPNPRDLSAIVTGLIIALMMPATIPYHVVVVAAIFAIAVVKQPFGGVGNNLFNPAAAGFSFAAICWPTQVFMYPMPFDKLAVFGENTATLYQNPAFVLRLGGLPTNDITEMLLGNYPGPMGATNILVILACVFYLLFRRTVHWQLPVFYLATCAAFALFFPRINGSGLQSVLYELMSGSLLFGAVFVISDPVTSPKRSGALAMYGLFAGSITMLFRYFGGFEESMAFSVLLANAFVPAIDNFSEFLHNWIRRKRIEVRESKKSKEAQQMV